MGNKKELKPQSFVMKTCVVVVRISAFPYGDQPIRRVLTHVTNRTFMESSRVTVDMMFTQGRSLGVYLRSESHQCHVIGTTYVVVQKNRPDPGMVLDGSQCGDDKATFTRVPTMRPKEPAPVVPPRPRESRIAELCKERGAEMGI
ncbi:hypothetical protein KIN20_017966, partial [Parelaphostrongylus tenuis]